MEVLKGQLQITPTLVSIKAPLNWIEQPNIWMKLIYLAQFNYIMNSRAWLPSKKLSQIVFLMTSYLYAITIEADSP